MSQNAFHSILRACDALSQTIQSHISNFIDNFSHQYEKNTHAPLSIKIPPHFSVSSKLTSLQPREAVEEDKDEGISLLALTSFKGELARPLTKEELGRSTWTLLHTIAAQYPDRPTKQQKRDIKELMVILSRLYPCKECADHFKEVLKANPIQAGSHAEFSQWLCHVHNVVNRSLGKVVFPCQRVDARWGKLECIDHGCDLQGADNSTASTT